jgi:hypothetical protein
MVKKKYILLILLLAGMSGLFSQTTIVFKPTFHSEKLVLNEKYYPLSGGDSILMETCKFYISSVELLYKKEVVYKEENSFHLVDAADSVSANLLLNVQPNIVFNAIRFNIGIDSTTNYGGALGGDLDPTKGMYWTWQNGYINFKLEGRSNLCATRNQEFVFHLGGYQYPHNTLQKVNLNIQKSSSVNIDIAIDKWLSTLNLKEQNHIMSPNDLAVKLSNQLRTIFTVSNK